MLWLSVGPSAVRKFLNTASRCLAGTEGCEKSSNDLYGQETLLFIVFFI